MKFLTNYIEYVVSRSIEQTLLATQEKWIQIVANRLATTRNDYIRSLTMEFPDAFTGILYLQGKWANMLEQGFPPFDMKKGFRRSPKVKKSKNNGWYLNIPFRHYAPSQAITTKQKMPSDIYRQARVLKAGDRLIGTEVKYPPRRSWTGYSHHSGIYENMMRTTQKSSLDSQYYTFRRVSDKSDPMSFWHPGYKGVQAINQVETYALRKFTEVLEQNL